jgi:hypothetical protein
MRFEARVAFQRHLCTIRWMRRFLLLASLIGIVASGGACSKPHSADKGTSDKTTVGTDTKAPTPTPDADLNKRVARLEKKLAKIENVLKQAGVPLDQPPEPDPNDVFNVPTNASDPTSGPPVAKVTIVEAFDFA